MTVDGGLISSELEQIRGGYPSQSVAPTQMCELCYRADILCCADRRKETESVSLLPHNSPACCFAPSMHAIEARHADYHDAFRLDHAAGYLQLPFNVVGRRRITTSEPAALLIRRVPERPALRRHAVHVLLVQDDEGRAARLQRRLRTPALSPKSEVRADSHSLLEHVFVEIPPRRR